MHVQIISLKHQVLLPKAPNMGGINLFGNIAFSQNGWVMYVLKPPAFTQIMAPILHEHLDGGTLFSVKPSAIHTYS